jgi:hypothetical protein
VEFGRKLMDFLKSSEWMVIGQEFIFFRFLAVEKRVLYLGSKIYALYQLTSDAFSDIKPAAGLF